MEDDYDRTLGALSVYDVLLVNPIMDGMNLVSKEGPTVNKRSGVLVLSRGAGSFEELGDHAVTIDDALDVGATADAIEAALELVRNLVTHVRHRCREGAQRVGEDDVAVDRPLRAVHAPDLHGGPEPVEELLGGAPGNHGHDRHARGETGEDVTGAGDGARVGRDRDDLGEGPVEVQEHAGLAGATAQRLELGSHGKLTVAVGILNARS
jgi:hypothetical protein